VQKDWVGECGLVLVVVGVGVGGIVEGARGGGGRVMEGERTAQAGRD
jgi:hypothetical protein